MALQSLTGGKTVRRQIIKALKVCNQRIFLFSYNNTLLACKLMVVFVVPEEADVNAAKVGQTKYSG